jgi:hypothetical protein
MMFADENTAAAIASTIRNGYVPEFVPFQCKMKEVEREAQI